MAVEVTNFGTAKDGREIKLYTIKNAKGMQAAVTNIGAILKRARTIITTAAFSAQW